MRTSRFDILPIEDVDDVTEYFHTKVWDDYSSDFQFFAGYSPVSGLQIRVRAFQIRHDTTRI